MRFLKRFFCTTLCIIILSLSIGTKYFDSNHMENVEAVAEGVAVGLSAAAMYAICFYIGTVAYANAPIEMNSLSDDQIVSMGYSTITYMVNNGLLDSLSTPSASVPSIPMIGLIDRAGQSVVFSEEAARRIAATSLLLIQMSANSPDNGDDDDGDDDDNDDDKSNIRVSNGLIEVAKNPKDLFACCGVGFGTILGTVIREQYDKYQNGEESIYSSDLEGHATMFTPADVTDQSAGNTYTYVWTVHNRYMYYEPWNAEHSSHMDTYIRSGSTNVRVAGFNNIQTGLDSSGREYVSYHHQVYKFDSRYGTDSFSQGGIGRFITDGEVITRDISKSLGDSITVHDGSQRSDYYNVTSTFTANFPIFSTREDMGNYLATGEGYEKALNYAEGYRIADWIQDDWKGKLLDPLTGLNALSNWNNIALHQGLNALGNEIDADAFDDYLRDYFANTNPDDYPLPSPDPSKAPIIWPSGVLDPETTIDPSRNPAILPDPSIKPDPDPDIKPDPGPGVNPDPGVDPDPGIKPDPDVVELPADELVPSISDSIGDLNIDLKNKFPFCIPWDLYYLLTFLSNLSDDSGISTYSDDHGGGGHSREPVEKKNGAPVFRLPIVIERYGIEEYIIIDMSPFEPLSKISRLLFTLMFVYTLVNWTVKIVSVRKDD